MKKTVLKVLSLLLVVGVCLSFSPLFGTALSALHIGGQTENGFLPGVLLTAKAAGAVKAEGDLGENGAVHWSLTEDGVMRITGSGAIPNYVGYYASQQSPLERDDVYQVIIEEGVTRIGNYAFYCCNNLNEVSIPSTVTSIGEGAFMYCDRLTHVLLPEGVVTVGSKAFNGCDELERVSVPSTVTSIGGAAFRYCDKLRVFEVARGNTAYTADDAGVLFSMEDGKKTCLIQYPAANPATSYTVPEEVKRIEDNAFDSCGLQCVVIGDGVETIGEDCFLSAESLSEVTFGSSLRTIGKNAFASCVALTAIAVPDSVTTIAPAAFYRCKGLTSVTLPRQLTAIERSLFLYCEKLEQIVIPDSVQTIGENAFNGCSALSRITLGRELENLADSAFTKCKAMRDIELSEENLFFRVEDGVLFDAAMKTLCYYPSAKEGLLYEIPSTVQTIRTCAFQDNQNLFSLGIPETVTVIGNGAFSECAILKEVWYARTEADAAAITIGNNNDSLSKAKACYGEKLPNADAIRREGCCGDVVTFTLTYGGILTLKGSGSTADYQDKLEGINPFYDVRQAILWITIEEGITRLGEYLFAHCFYARSVFMPTGLKEIGNGALYDCESVTRFDLPESLTSIGNDAFAGCYALTEVVLPDSVTELGASAFCWDKELKKVVLPTGLKTIRSCTFNDCTSLSDVVLPAQLNRIENSAFDSTAIETVEIPQGCQYLDGMAFYRCASLKKVSIPASVISIGDGSESITAAFGACSTLQQFTVAKENPVYCAVDGVLFSKDKKTLVQYAGTKETYAVPEGTKVLATESLSNTQLREITLPQSLLTIGHSALSGNHSLTSLVIPDNVVRIEDFAFSRDIALESITLNDKIEFIDDYTFYNCHVLKSVTVPSSVKYIGDSAFLFCLALEEVTIKNPDCIIYDSSNTLNRSVRLASTQGSTAQAHAKRYGMAFRDVVTNEVSDYSITADNLVQFLPTDLTVDFDPASLKEEDKAAYNALKELADSITADCQTEEEKVKAILQWTTNALTYRYFTLPPEGIQSIYNFLLKNGEAPRYANCMGYTAVFNFLTELEGIPTAVVFVGGEHECSVVLIDSKWVFVEPQGSFDIGFSSAALIDSIQFIDHGWLMIIATCNGVTFGSNYTEDEIITLPDYVAEIRDIDNAEIYAGNVNTVFSSYAKKTFCSYTETDGTFTAKAHDWKYQYSGSESGTCCNIGARVYRCIVCGQERTELDFMRDSHDWDKPVVLIPATTEENGLRVKACKRCGITKYEETKLCEHKWDKGTVEKEATCVEDGIMVYECYKCDEIRQEVIPAAHKLVETAAKKATCTAMGHVAYFICTVCRKTFSDENGINEITDVTVPANGHTFDAGKVTKEPTCKADGVKTFTCTVCGETKTETLVKTAEHKWDSGKVTKEATASAEGVKTYTCTVCGITKTESIPKLADHTHTWDAGKVTKAPTCKADGVKTYTCTVCGTKKTETLVKTADHQWDSGKVTKEATETAEGVKTYTCTVCGETKTETIPKPVPADPVTPVDPVTPTDPDNPDDPAEPAPPIDAERRSGDVDGDGKITAADARLALRASVGLKEKDDVTEGSAGYLACDVDGDNKVTSADARLILRASVGLEDATKFGKKA